MTVYAERTASLGNVEPGKDIKCGELYCDKYFCEAKNAHGKSFKADVPERLLST